MSTTVLKLTCLTLFGVFLMSILDPNEETFVFPAEVPPAFYEESKVPEYVLPDPLVAEDGTKIETARQWTEKRRPELLELFAEHVYGKEMTQSIPNVGFGMNSMITEKNENALGGKATRIQMEFKFGSVKIIDQVVQPLENAVAVNVLIYLPNRVNGEVPQPGTVPAFIGYNFQGNHTVDNDPGIKLPFLWTRTGNVFERVQAEESTRGAQASRWQVEKVIDAGFALITAHYCDVVPDFPGGRKEGIQGLFDTEAKTQSTGNEWGAIAAWAFGLSRIYDHLNRHEALKTINLDKVAVVGHSRLGKTALWAGATDERFALVISNNSGCGGAALSRREFGETIWRMNEVFPHWLSGNCKEYNARINDCPVDQHQLIALIAPRPVYIASATEDLWADPKGEFLSGFHADPVYKLLGTEGIGDVKEMPAPDTPVGKTIQYHNRTGEHDITEYDWDQYIRFAKEHFQNK